MKTSTKNKFAGTSHQIKGAVKQTVGNATHDRRRESEGNAEKNAGKMQKKSGDFEKRLGEGNVPGLGMESW
ncbi:MAG TPA: CsbD family protein [Bryobacteraceae bacterium]|jgi:uncharacterized protein YjbJ (UPF0337 family)|nr:CsbD family protein [Bryobacteraceae bacterium]